MSEQDEIGPYDIAILLQPPKNDKLDWRWRQYLELAKTDYTIQYAGLYPADQVIRNILLPFTNRRDNGVSDAIPDNIYESVQKVIDAASSSDPETIRMRHLMEAGILGGARLGNLISDEYGLSSWEQSLFEAVFYDARGLLSMPKLLEHLVFYPIDISTDEAVWALKAKVIAYELWNDEFQKWLGGIVGERAWLIGKKVESTVSHIKFLMEYGVPAVTARKIAFKELFEFAEQVKTDLRNFHHGYVYIPGEFYFEDEEEEEEVTLFSIPE